MKEITRIVKMTFRHEEVGTFLSLFEKYRERISSVRGCTHLELLRDKANAHVFFTYSKWLDESFLETYRNSELFAEVWPLTKALFNAPAEAWTCE